MQKKITNLLDEDQPYKQGGFRSGYSMTDQLQTIDQVTEKIIEYYKPF